MKRLSGRELYEILSTEDSVRYPEAMRELAIRRGVRHEDVHVKNSFHFKPNARTKERIVGGDFRDPFPGCRDFPRGAEGGIPLTKAEERELRKNKRLKSVADRAMKLARKTLKPAQKKRRHKASIHDILGYHGADDYLNQKKYPDMDKWDVRQSLPPVKVKKKVARPEDTVARKRRRNKHNQHKSAMAMLPPWQQPKGQ